MKTSLQIYKYLKFKHKFVRGTTLCKALRISHVRLKSLNTVRGIGSFGPCTRKELSAIRYAKYNAFSASFIAFFEHAGRYRCHKERPRMRGARVPKSPRYKYSLD